MRSKKPIQKICATCGNRVPVETISCPKCGKGIIISERGTSTPSYSSIQESNIPKIKPLGINIGRWFRKLLDIIRRTKVSSDEHTVKSAKSERGTVKNKPQNKQTSFQKIKQSEDRSEYSWVRDQFGEFHGIWFLNPNQAADREIVAATIAYKRLTDKGLPESLIKQALLKDYRIVSNNYNSKGGCFVMFDDVKAPGKM